MAGFGFQALLLRSCLVIEDGLFRLCVSLLAVFASVAFLDSMEFSLY